MRTALVIAGKDLRQRLRDRSAIVLGVVAPLLIAALMSFAFRGGESFHLRVAVVDEDGSELAGAFLDVLRSPDLEDILTVEVLADEQGAITAVDSDDAQAAIVIPDGFEASVSGAAPLPLRVLTSVDRVLAGEVTRSIAGSFVAQVSADRLAVATTLAAGASIAELADLAAEAAEERLPVTAVQRPSGAKELAPISYFAPAMGIFFMLFAISFGSRGYFLEQRGGTLERMTAAARPGVVLVGKSLSVYVYGVVSLTTIAVFTTLLFGADWGGPVPAAALILSVALAVVCLTVLVTAVARTERQAEGVASIVTFGLALLGGSFLMVSQAPPLLRRLSLLTPNGWALRGFTDLATGDRSLATVGQPVTGILVFSAVVAVAALVVARRRGLT